MAQPGTPTHGSYLRLEAPGTPPPPRGSMAPHAAPLPGHEGCGAAASACALALLACLRGLCGISGDDASVSAPQTHERARQYRAPGVASPRRAASGSSSGDGDHEHGTLLPKRVVLEAAGASSSMAANAMELPRQRHGGVLRGAWTPPPEPGRSAAAPAAAQPGRACSPTPGGPSSSGRLAAEGGGAKGVAADGAAGSATGNRHARKLSREAMVAALAGSAAVAVSAAASTGTQGSGKGSGSGGADGGAAATTPLALLLGAVEQDEDDDVCPTCLEVYSEDNPKIWTGCGHHFHMQCLYEWLERKETCPLCESVISFDGLTI